MWASGLRDTEILEYSTEPMSPPPQNTHIYLVLEEDYHSQLSENRYRLENKWFKSIFFFSLELPYFRNVVMKTEFLILPFYA
jgi:hypothetical protein